MMRLLQLILCIVFGAGLGALSPEGSMSLLHGQLVMSRSIPLACVPLHDCLLFAMFLSSL